MADALSHLLTNLGYLKRQEERVLRGLQGVSTRVMDPVLRMENPDRVLRPHPIASLHPSHPYGMESGE